MTAGDVTAAVAAYGLPDTELHLPGYELDPASWQHLLDDAAQQCVTGHLVNAIADGVLPATAAQQTTALARHESALALDLLLERLLLDRVAALNDAGIATRVLKGPVLAHTVYPNAGLRSFRDIDLLVPGAQYDAAIEVLRAGGGQPRFTEPRPGFNRRFGKGVCIKCPSGLEIDVHRTLVAGPFGLTLDPDKLFSTECTITLGGRQLMGLDPDARFVHACIHAYLGDPEPRVVALRDVAQILLHSTINLERVLRLCASWRCGIVVQQAIKLTWDTFRIRRASQLGSWARTYEPSAFERWALSAYRGIGRSYARQAVAGLWAVPGIRAKAAYAWTFLAPTGEYVRARDGNYVRRLRRGIGLLVDSLPIRQRPNGRYR